jgi:hypothetical protein
VLSAWLLGGLLLCIVGAVRDRSRTVTDQTTLSQPLTPARA